MKKSTAKSKATTKRKTSGKSTKRKASTKKAGANQPAYFLSLTVENVRCFGPKQILDLSDGKGRPAQWTIILGNNGLGKTTLLRSLVALTPREPVLNSEQPLTIVTPKYIVGSKLYSSWPALRHSPGRLFMTSTFHVGTLLSGNETGEVLDGFSVKMATTAKGGFKGEYALIDYKKLGNLLCFGYGASRRMSQTSLSEKADDDDPFASLFSDDVALLNAEEWLLQANYVARAASDSAVRKRAVQRRDDIKKVLVRLLPDVENIRFAKLTKKQLKPRVEFKTPYGWVSLQDLSLGYKTLIAWMVDLASRLFDRYPDSRNPLAEPAVVLVDEIDLHLHPKWQRELVSFLSELFPNTQFIATTHSPLVVQAAAEANLVVLRREGDHVLIDNEVESVEGWRVDQILTGEPFELKSARPPKFDELIDARREILSKSKMTTKDRARLRGIESDIGTLPAGETPQEIRALDIISRAAARIKSKE